MNRSRSLALLTACSALFLFAPDADARSGRQNQVPNGVSFNCLTCHQSAAGGSALNDFGDDVFASGLTSQDANGSVVWANLYNLDSDGDGMTNGAELGDPDGTWMTGDANPSVTATNPGVADMAGDGDTDGGTGDGDGDGDGDTDGGTGDGDGDTDGGTGDGMGGCSSHSVPTDGAPVAALGLIAFGVLFSRRRR